MQKNARCRREFVVTKLFNIAINDFDVKKSDNSGVLVVSGTQCSGSFVYCKRAAVMREHFLVDRMLRQCKINSNIKY